MSLSLGLAVILTNREFVERMYNNILLRSSDYVGLNGWVWALNNGQVTRAQVALSFLDSDEFQNLSCQSEPGGYIAFVFRHVAAGS